MPVATSTRETASFIETNARLQDFLAHYKQLNELFGITDGLTEPRSHSAGKLGVAGQPQLVLNIPRGFRVKAYRGDGSAFHAIHREGQYDGYRTRESYGETNPFEAHQLLGEIKTDQNYHVASSLKLTGHMPSDFDLPTRRTMRSVSITEPLENYVLYLATRGDNSA